VVNMGLNYDRDHQTRGKSEKERILLSVGKFPGCKGLYPDCPSEPSLNLSMCRTCPKTDNLKKPRIEVD